jgi:hypothetical protein
LQDVAGGNGSVLVTAGASYPESLVPVIVPSSLYSSQSCRTLVVLNQFFSAEPMGIPVPMNGGPARNGTPYPKLEGGLRHRRGLVPEST